MAEIRETVTVKSNTPRAESAVAEGGRSALSCVGAQPFLQGSEIAAVSGVMTAGSTSSRQFTSTPQADFAGPGHEMDSVPRSSPYILIRKEGAAQVPENTRGHTAPASPPVLAPSLTIAPGAVVIEGGTKPPEEQAREIVKHIKAELERLSYKTR
jgi:hypothetical protein